MADGFRSRLRTYSGEDLSAVGQPFADIVTRIEQQKRDSLAALAGTLVRQIKIYLSFPGTGRIYRRAVIKRDGTRKLLKKGGFAVRTHQASAPGFPPAVDFGTLRNSIDMQEIKRAVFRVGTNVEYAPDLEFGTLGDGGHVAPRPFMRPALESVKLWWGRQIVADLQRATRRR